MDETGNYWQRRQAKLDARKLAIRKHGKNLAQVYANATRKRAIGTGKRGPQ